MMDIKHDNDIQPSASHAGPAAQNAGRPVGVAVVGCGGRQVKLVSMLAKASERLRIVALIDPNPQAIDRMQTAIGGNAKPHNSYRDALVDPDVDWVMIGTPNNLHATQAMAALEAGKDVFCEKPVAIDMPESMQLHKVWQRTGRRLFVGFNLRYSPHYRKLHELINTGQVGQVLNMELNETLSFNHGGFSHQGWRAHKRLAGPLLLHKCCHDIDIAYWLAGALPSRVASFGGRDFFAAANRDQIKRIGNHPATGDIPFMSHNSRSRELENPFNDEHDSVDNQVAIIEFANGVRSTFFFSCLSGLRQRRAHICGAEGTIDSNALRGAVKLTPIGWNTESTTFDTSAAGGHGGADPMLIAQLAECMLNGTAPPNSFTDSLVSTITCLAIEEAMAESKVVALTPCWAELGLT